MKFTRKKIIPLCIAILGMFMILSCGDKSKKIQDVVNDASVSNDAEIKKYNGYIDFYNHFLSNQFNRDIDNYLNEVGDGATIKKGEKTLTTSAYSGWSRIESTVKSQPPMKELDRTAEELLPICKELDELLVAAKEYYTAKDYLDDNYAKGQELHTKIITAIKKFDEANAKFDFAMREKEGEYQNKEMEKAKKDGYEITYNKILVLQLIDKIMAEINAQKLDATNVVTADLTKIKPLYEEFNKAQKAFRDACQNDEMLKKENFSKHSPALEAYINETTKFKTKVLDLIDRVEKKEPVDKLHLNGSYFRGTAKGTPENLSKAREAVVGAYNRSW